MKGIVTQKKILKGLRLGLIVLQYVYYSEQNGSTKTYLFTHRIRNVFCLKVFVINANLKERIRFQQCPLTKATGFLID